MSYQQQEHQQQANSNDQQQTPWHISEANSDCLHVFEKLKVQREQCRFTDLFLIVQGRNFPAHRCVLAACSHWFDARLKVHKNIRECLELDQCKDYKIFYALLEYCYTAQLSSPVLRGGTKVPNVLGTCAGCRFSSKYIQVFIFDV
jgi:hypothetical protein